MKFLRPIMFVGTGSDVGKSVINTAFCRIFKQDGYSPAPFKAQNMAPNSYVTTNGLEMGRAQAVQAEACGLAGSVEMNPLLLKPTNDQSSQVILNGRSIGHQSAREYFNQTNRDLLFLEAMKSLDKLAQQHSPIVIEGAGSISEINLWDRDITNMRVAEYISASTYLVADIDRGGVFASVYGSIQLLPPEQRKLIKGIIINKFRGDEALFEDGKRIIKELTGIPVVGVIPYFRDIFIEQEDSIVEDKISCQAREGKINIGIVLLPRISNFTDFDTLQHIPEVNLFYIRQAEDVENADIIILPGSRNAIDDMIYIQEKGIDKTIVEHHKKQKPLFGIGGGYTMMGQTIKDPHHKESKPSEVKGLGIFPTTTTITKEVRSKNCKFTFLHQPIQGNGYILSSYHTKSNNPLCIVDEEKAEGYYLNPQTWGADIHGLLDNTAVVESLLQLIQPSISVTFSYHEIKEKGYNQLADWVRNKVNMDYIYQSLEL